ncbi:hypothetical protein AC579_1434 [Pseudocercospora musae]|uniref:Uncharacterized protein n=1 Tax=Pseudocercospora musae TaxID=113226 RepID=A0A139IMW7_9PEZI|nr:hypothetical protein AC579_1434 [Pseudocercospora musae]
MTPAHESKSNLGEIAAELHIKIEEYLDCQGLKSLRLGSRMLAKNTSEAFERQCFRICAYSSSPTSLVRPQKLSASPFFSRFVEEVEIRSTSSQEEEMVQLALVEAKHFISGLKIDSFGAYSGRQVHDSRIEVQSDQIRKMWSRLSSLHVALHDPSGQGLAYDLLAAGENITSLTILSPRIERSRLEWGAHRLQKLKIGPRRPTGIHHLDTRSFMALLDQCQQSLTELDICSLSLQTARLSRSCSD